MSEFLSTSVSGVITSICKQTELWQLGIVEVLSLVSLSYLAACTRIVGDLYTLFGKKNCSVLKVVVVTILGIRCS